MKKIIILGLILGSVLCAAEEILATIATDNHITAADVQARVDAMPSQYVQFYNSPDGKAEILKQLIEEKLLALDATIKGYADNPDVQKALATIKEEIMVNQYIRDAVNSLTVSDAEINAFYNEHKEQFVEPEAVRASHILVDTEDAAKAIIVDLNNGKDFAAVAQELSTDTGSAVRGGDLGFFIKGQMVAPFEQEAFALKVGELSKAPVQSDFGWHIIKVAERRDAQQLTLDSVKQDIRNELLMQKQRAQIQKLINDATEKYPVKKAE